MNDSIIAKSSRFQVLPIEKVPFGFSLALCIRTRPDFFTATTMTRGFLFSGDESGGGGDDGDAASSVIRMCVMYDSESMSVSAKAQPLELQAWAIALGLLKRFIATISVFRGGKFEEQLLCSSNIRVPKG